MKLKNLWRIGWPIGVVVVAWLALLFFLTQCFGFTDKEIKGYAEATGVLIGGLWAVSRVVMHREYETILAIDLTPHIVPRSPDGYIVFLDVAFTNRGSVRLKANPCRHNTEIDGYPYKDDGEALKYSGSLLLRKIPDKTKVGAEMAWFSDTKDGGQDEPDIEVDLLSVYENDKGRTDFFMEPGECCQCGATLVLEAGLYLAMVTFVGAEEDDFWRRIFLLNASSPPRPIRQSLDSAGVAVED